MAPKKKKKRITVVHSQVEWERRLRKKEVSWVIKQLDPCVRNSNGVNYSRALGVVLKGVRERLRSGDLSPEDVLGGGEGKDGGDGGDGGDAEAGQDDGSD